MVPLSCTRFVVEDGALPCARWFVCYSNVLHVRSVLGTADVTSVEGHGALKPSGESTTRAWCMRIRMLAILRANC